MASDLYTEDPRTGCWAPVEGVSVGAVYERFRGELPYGSKLVGICPTDGCANPEHLRPTFFVTAEAVAELTEEIFKEGTPAPDESVNTPVVVEPSPVPKPTMKRGPGRPRKTR